MSRAETDIEIIEPAADVAAPAASDAVSFEPAVRGESRLDRVASMLMAVVIGASLVVGWLLLIYLTNQAYASRVTAPLEIVEVFGGGGGSPDGTPGSTEAVDVRVRRRRRRPPIMRRWPATSRSPA